MKPRLNYGNAVRKEMRRESARARFRILNYHDWFVTRHGVADTDPSYYESAEARAHYNAYVERKRIEQRALNS